MADDSPPGPPVTQAANRQRQIDEARDTWLILQAAAEGYRQNVRWLERTQGLLDFLSFLVAIWLIAALWGIKELIPPGDNQAWITTLVNVIGTTLALALVSLTVMSWRKEWRGKTDRHRQLGDQADRLASRFQEIFQADEFDEGRYARARTDHRSFVSEENQPLGGVPEWARQKGFQHVGLRHPVQNIHCHVCDRRWIELRPLLRSWLRRLWRGKCNNCGVAL